MSKLTPLCVVQHLQHLVIQRMLSTVRQFPCDTVHGGVMILFRRSIDKIDYQLLIYNNYYYYGELLLKTGRPVATYLTFCYKSSDRQAKIR